MLIDFHFLGNPSSLQPLGDRASRDLAREFEATQVAFYESVGYTL